MKCQSQHGPSNRINSQRAFTIMLKTGAAIAALGVSGTAQAACNPVGANDIECTGNTPGPVVLTGSNQTVTVVSGATVEQLRVTGSDQTVVVDGTVETTGPSTFALAVDVTSGDATVTHSGTATADGDSAVGISIVARGTGTASLTSSGLISTSGNFSFGAIVASTSGNALANLTDTSQLDFDSGTGIGYGLYLQADQELAAVNAGSINGTGTSTTNPVIGIFSINSGSTGSRTVLTNDGSIFIDAPVGRGISAQGQNVLQVTNNGVIAATGGLDTIAIETLSGRGDAIIANAGEAFADGIGVSLQKFAVGEVQISNSGIGTIQGGNVGIQVEGIFGPVQISNAGTITQTNMAASGSEAAIIVRDGTGSTGSSVFLDNSGTISGVSGVAISASMGANGTFDLTNAGSIEGDITFATGLGSTILNTGVIDGDVSLTDADDAFAIRTADARINGDVDGNDGDDLLSFTDVVGQVYSGSILDIETIQIAGVSALTFDSASLSTSASTGNLSIAADSALTITGGTTSIDFADGGDVTNFGAMVIDAGAVLAISGTNAQSRFRSEDGSTVTFVINTVAGASDIAGQIQADTIGFSADTQIDVDVRDMDLLVNGTTIDVAVANDLLTDASGAVSDNSVLFDFTKEVIGGTILRLTMEQLLSIADTINAADPNSGALAGALQDLIDSNTPSGDTVSTVLGQFPDAASLAEAVADFAPDDSNAVALSQLGAINRTHRIVRGRQAAHDLSNGDVKLWVLGGLSGQNLDDRGFSNGYDGDGWHLAGGIDAGLGDTGGFVIGAGYDFGSGDYTRNGSRMALSEVSSNRIFAYGFNRSGPLRFSADFGIGWGDADFMRNIDSLSEIATGSTDISSTFGRIELGYGFGAASEGKAGFSFTPVAGLQFANVDVDGFAETGSAGALAYGDRSISSTRGDAGAILTYAGGSDDGVTWRLEADVRIAHEFNDLDDPVSANFVGGGSAFVYSVNRPGQTSGLVDLTAHFAIGGSTTVSLGYQGDFASGNDAHAGTASISIGF